MTLSSNNRRFDPSQTPSSQTDSLQLQRRQGNALNDITNKSQEYDSIKSHAHSSISPSDNAGPYASVANSTTVAAPTASTITNTIPVAATKPAQATSTTATTTATTSTTATTVPAKKPSQPSALQQLRQAVAARGQQANITPEQIEAQTQAMVQAASQAQAVVSAAKSRGDGIVPMTAQQIAALSQIQAQTIVNARPQTALLASGTPTVDKDGKPVQPTPAQIQHQITLQARALVYAHTQAQIAAGIFKGDISSRNDNCNDTHNAIAESHSSTSIHGTNKPILPLQAECEETMDVHQTNSFRFHTSAPKQPIPCTQEADEKGFALVKNIVYSMRERGDWPTYSIFVKQYPDLGKKYHKKSLTNTISRLRLQFDSDDHDGQFIQEKVSEISTAAIAEAANLKRKMLQEATISGVAEAANLKRKMLKEATISGVAEAANLKRKMLKEAEKKLLQEAATTAVAEADKLKEARKAMLQQIISSQQIMNQRLHEISTAATAEAANLKRKMLQEAATAAIAEAANLRENIFQAGTAVTGESVKLRQKMLQAAVSVAVRFQEKDSKRQKRMRQIEDNSRESLPEKMEELLKEATLRCPIPKKDVRSVEEMNSDFIRCTHSKDKEREREITEEFRTCYFLSLLLASKRMYFHFGVCDINQMQKTDDKEAVLPYALFDYLHSLMDHVAHLDELQTLFANLRADSPELFSWWVPFDLLYCIVFGLNHARDRGTIPVLEGSSVYIHCKYSMRHGHDVYHAPFGLPQLQKFRVCPKPVFTDSVMKITFGADGLDDPATQIHLVRIEGMACNIHIW